MAWFVLVLSGVMEAVWATALGKSEGITRPAHRVVVFLLGLVACIVGVKLVG
ncbi:MAG: hypothetical protein R6W77_04000 [Trueperaceae bacterium]